MKKNAKQFALRMKMFSLTILGLLAFGITSACTGLDASVLADTVTTALSIGGGATVLATVPWMVMLDGAKALSFKELSDDELTKLTDEDQGKYVASLIQWQQKSIKKLEEQSEKDADNREEVAKQLHDLKEANISAMKTSLESMGTQMSKLMKEIEGKSDNKTVSFKQAVLKELESKKDEIAERMESKSGVISLHIKDFATKASQGAADIDEGQDFAFMEPGVGQIATRQTFIRNLFPNRPTNKEYVKYNDQETVVRDAKNVANCTASTHNSKITWKVRETKMEKVRDMVDVCIDMMDDYDFVTGEIRALVDTDVKLKVDEGLLLGDNISPNLNSIDNVASTFAAGTYATTVAKAQLIDLIYVAACQIADAGLNNKFMANVALLNPKDECLMQLTKDENGNYLLPSWITGNGKVIGSVTIMTNPLVPVDEAYVMDSTKGVVYNRRGITIELAFENKDNFEKELVTVKAYERLNFRVRNVDANAFMHIADIPAAITAIDKP